MFLRGIFTVLLLFSVLPNLFSQKRDSTGFGVGINPLYWFQNALRLDVEKRVKNSPHWFSLGYMYYNGPVNSAGDANIAPTPEEKTRNGDAMKGFGFELQHKIFLKKNAKISNTYLAYGPVFKQFTINLNEIVWHPVEIDGQQFLTHDSLGVTQNIQQVGLSLVAGKKLLSPNGFGVDIYGGLGYKNSTVNVSEPGFRSYDRHMWDFAYSGLQLIGGLRISYYVKQKRYRK